jgi:hypothetical protein
VSVDDSAGSLLERLERSGPGTDPMAFQGQFREAATSERTLSSDAGVIAEMASDEEEQLKKKPEAEQKPEDRGRAIQLANLGLYLERARNTMASARHMLGKLAGNHLLGLII